jgi:N-acetylglucosamine malate deacetylase 1
MAVEVLLIGAHPDDVEWGAGGIALLLRNSGISFAILDLTDGEMGSRGTPEVRKVEAAKAAEFTGASAREALHLPDCGLIDAPEHRRRIASVIRRYRPKSRLYCTLAKLDDANPPHKPSAFFFYALHQTMQPSFVVDTTDVFPAKLDLLRMHRSQFAETAEEFGVLAHGVGDYLFGLESRDRYFGSLIGVRFGEALVADQPVRLAGVGSILDLLR